jgi:hypothetical protein
MENFKTGYCVAQDRQKSYVDIHRRNVEFVEGDKVFLRVAPMKGVTRFGKKGKLNPVTSDCLKFWRE